MCKSGKKVKKQTKHSLNQVKLMCDRFFSFFNEIVYISYIKLHTGLFLGLYNQYIIKQSKRRKKVKMDTNKCYILLLLLSGAVEFYIKINGKGGI